MERASVRVAQPTDFVAIRDLFGELDRFHAGSEPRLLRVPPVPRLSPTELAELIACESCFLAVAELDGEVVGFIDASIRGPEDATDQDQPWCSVHNLAVKADQRRQGIGGQLMRAAEEWAQRKGLTDLRLNVFAFNEGARAFYAQLGYRMATVQLHKALPGAANNSP